MSNKTPDQIDGFIKSTLKALSKEHSYFGFTEVGNHNAHGLEQKFQEHLCKILNSRSCSEFGWEDWHWCREIEFKTYGLTNRCVMKMDVIGRPNSNSGSQPSAVIIELKYVTSRYDNILHKHNPPNDAPAFPYDLLKDCVKVELALTENAQTSPRNPIYKPFYGVSIGLTNIGRYWMPKDKYSSWARNYYRAIAEKEIPDAGFILTDTKRVDNAIFRNSRSHLSFSYPWKFDSIEYSNLNPEIISKFNVSEEKYQKFRFIYCRPIIEDKGKHKHDQTNPRFIPFLNENTRNDFFQHRK